MSRITAFCIIHSDTNRGTEQRPSSLHHHIGTMTNNVDARDEHHDSRCDDGEQFIMLVSSSEEEANEEPDETNEKKPSLKKKRKKLAKEAMLADELTRAIEKTPSTDSGVFQDQSCGNCLSSMFRLNPDTIVVRVLSFARPYNVNKNKGLCEPMPLKGTPELIMVGKVMSKTLEHCPIQFGDRVMAFVGDEFESETLANLPFQSLIKMKKNLEPWQQVSIALSYLPALQALQSAPFTVEGSKVLLNGGLGPVIQALTHLTLLHGAKRVYVPVENSQAGFIRGFGARPVGPRHSDWSRQLIEKIDLVIDGIGENKFITSNAMLVEHGHMIVIGATALDARKDEFFYPVTKMLVDIRLQSYDRSSIFDYGKSLQQSLKADRAAFLKDFKYLDKLVWEGTLPIINTEISLNEYKSGRAATSIYDGYDIVTVLSDKHESIAPVE